MNVRMAIWFTYVFGSSSWSERSSSSSISVSTLSPSKSRRNLSSFSHSHRLPYCCSLQHGNEHISKHRSKHMSKHRRKHISNTEMNTDIYTVRLYHNIMSYGMKMRWNEWKKRISRKKPRPRPTRVSLVVPSGDLYIRTAGNSLTQHSKIAKKSQRGKPQSNN